MEFVAPVPAAGDVPPVEHALRDRIVTGGPMLACSHDVSCGTFRVGADRARPGQRGGRHAPLQAPFTRRRKEPMTEEPNRQRPLAPPKRGDAAWREHRAAIADRNERATRRARARRQEEDERQLARRREAEVRERAELAKRFR